MGSMYYVLYVNYIHVMVAIKLLIMAINFDMTIDDSCDN